MNKTCAADECYLCCCTASHRSVSGGVANGTTSSGPSQNGLVVGIVIGAFVMFIATVIGSVVSTCYTTTNVSDDCLTAMTTPMCHSLS